MLDKIRKKKRELLYNYVVLNLLYILITAVLRFYKIIDLQYYSYGLIVLLIINIIIIIGIFRYDKDKLNKKDLILVFIGIFSLLSYLGAYDKYVALLGFYNRYEGLLQIYYYLTIFFISSFIDNKDKKKIIYIILFIGVINTIYAFYQLGYDLRLKIFDTDNPNICGLITNPNFYGTLMILCLGSSIGLFLEEKEKKRKIIFAILSIVFMIGLLLANTLSCFIGLIGIIIYLIIYAIIKKKYKNYIIVILGLIVITISMSSIKLTSIIGDFNKTNYEVKEISKGNLNDQYGTRRIYLWKETVKIIPKYLIHGVGIDNFYYAFGKPLKLKGDIRVFDKAHSEYLQILVTEGIFSLISYLVFYILIVIYGIKKSYKKKELYLILPIGGYLIQALFNISVIEVAPIFYIIMGLIIEREKNNNI